MSHTVSVIVRAKDRARTLGAALASLRAQDHDLEVVVVDSGSTDGTVEIARREADRLIEIPAAQFSYGGALNLGAEAAAGSIHVALSAHCVLPDRGWIARAVAHFDDPRVAGATGQPCGPTGARLDAPVLQNGHPEHDPDPYWGYSNHAGCWRADVWRDHRFDETLVAAEDKEWANRVRRAGFTIVLDPLLQVSATHRRREGARALYLRSVREGQAVRLITGRPPMTVRQAIAAWATTRRGVQHPPLLQLVNPYRVVNLAGRYVGERQDGRRIPRGSVHH